MDYKSTISRRVMLPDGRTGIVADLLDDLVMMVRVDPDEAGRLMADQMVLARSVSFLTTKATRTRG